MGIKDKGGGRVTVFICQDVVSHVVASTVDVMQGN